MALETRFARAASGPVPYRVDGAGPRQLLVISDWAHPYGEPGVAAFDAFTRTLMAAGAQVVTVLDGTIGGAEGKRPDTERRIAAARATAEATALTQATLLGAGGGAPVAALLAAREPERFARLILYDAFPPEAKKTWAIGAPPDLSETVADLEKLESELKTAGAAWDWAQNWFKTKGKASGGSPRGEAPFPGVPLPEVPGSDTPAPPFGPPPGLKDGLRSCCSTSPASKVLSDQTRVPGSLPSRFPPSSSRSGPMATHPARPVRWACRWQPRSLGRSIERSMAGLAGRGGSRQPCPSSWQWHPAEQRPHNH